MDIASSCPACGAQMTIDSGAQHASCPFCGMKYDVDLSGVEPALKVAAPSNEMPDVPEPERISPPIAEPARPPVQPQFVPAGHAAGQPGGILSSPRIPQAVRRQPIWVIIAVIVGLVLCIAFGCLASVFLVFRAFTGS